MSDHATAMYGFCQAFFEEFKGAGVRHVVVSPGARSTPLVLEADRAGLEIWVQIDERSAGFFALGMAKRLREPVGLICTSGSAAANYLPAVVEADRSGTPLVVLTADRPPELRGWGSNQTIDQVGLYGTAPRWFAELPVASESTPEVARRFAARAAATALAAPVGPVHLNFPFREPMSPTDQWPPALPSQPPSVVVRSDVVPDTSLVEALRSIVAENPRGMILAGALTPGDLDVADVLAFAATAGWPILAEPASQLRVAAPESSATVVSTATHLLRNQRVSDRYRPDVVVLIGAAPPQRVLRQWLKSLEGARIIVVGDGAEWHDESFGHTDVFRCDASSLFAATTTALDPASEASTEWCDGWQRADVVAASAINDGLIESGLFEGRVVTALAGVLPDDTPLYVGNSMAVRDVNLYWPRRDRPLDIFSNRGASGIDGMISSALGVTAASGGPAVLFLGDLSLLHDLSGLLSAVRLGANLVIVVTNNDGGGIFSFLPFSDHVELDRFRELFHTPHGADLSSVVTGIGAHYVKADTSTAIQVAVIDALDAGGPSVVEVAVDAEQSVAAHRAIDAAVTDALSQRW